MSANVAFLFELGKFDYKPLLRLETKHETLLVYNMLSEYQSRYTLKTNKNEAQSDCVINLDTSLTAMFFDDIKSIKIRSHLRLNNDTCKIDTICSDHQLSQLFDQVELFMDQQLLNYNKKEHRVIGVRLKKKLLQNANGLNALDQVLQAISVSLALTNQRLQGDMQPLVQQWQAQKNYRSL